MKKIAFLGDEHKGEEILNVLQLLGGENSYKCHCNNKSCFYYIDDENNYIISDFITQDNNIEEKFKLFTFEEFKKNYSYVFEENVISIWWDNGLEEIFFISSDKEKQTTYSTQKKESINKIDFTTENYENEVELELGNDREIINENGKIKIIKKKYPTSYQECCATLGIQVGGELLYDIDDNENYTSNYNDKLTSELDDFRKLIICRNAYWKISGDWNPNWEDETDKYTISFKCNEIFLNNTMWYSEVLAFPTPEIRNDFYEHFKDIIEKCKHFL